jgi:predicted aconitase with swiveling domain
MMTLEIKGDPVVPGDAEGKVLKLDAPLSFWGGVDPATGLIVDVHHPQHGARITGRVLAMPGGRGSSSSSSTLLECVRAGTAPAAILLGRLDTILPIGAVVARELYGHGPAVVRVDARLDLLSNNDNVSVDPAGRVLLKEGSP